VIKHFFLGPLLAQNTKLDSLIAFEIVIPCLDKVTAGSQLFCVAIPARYHSGEQPYINGGKTSQKCKLQLIRGLAFSLLLGMYLVQAT
jgi:hypothetical protein